MYFDKTPARGYNVYIDAEKDDLGTMMDVGLLVLEKGDSWHWNEQQKEVSLTLLCGDAELRWDDRSERITRRDMFRDDAYCLLVCRKTEISVTACAHSEIYVQNTVNEREYPAQFYRPEDITVQRAGASGELKGCMRRDIKTFFDYDNAPFSNMVLGEVLNYPGKWSSYPPHHHPQPEVYLHRFDHPQGFGVSFTNGEAHQTRDYGLSVINYGCHWQVTAPGYAMCYLWGIRHLDGDPWKKTRIDDKEHAWLWAPDANDGIFDPDTEDKK